MSIGLRSGSDLLVRLLCDAEALAKNGRQGDAYLLLRWASRIAPPEGLPVVLLAYQRIRLEGSVSGHAGVPIDGGEAERRPIRGAGIASDPLGFPVPRFPTRVPSVDASSFVPATPVDVTPAKASAGESRPGGRTRISSGLILCIGLLAVAGALSPGTVRRLVEAHPLARSADPSEAAEAALRSGDPRRALSLGSVPEPSARLRLIRGQALLAIGDSAAAESELVRAAADARADDQVCIAAGEILGRMGRVEAAADAYLRAFSAGLQPERWPDVVAALERAGRRDQAGRLRDLLPSGASRGP